MSKRNLIYRPPVFQISPTALQEFDNVSGLKLHRQWFDLKHPEQIVMSMLTLDLEEIPKMYRYGLIHTQSATDINKEEDEEEYDDTAATTTNTYLVTANSINSLLVSQLRGMKIPKLQRYSFIDFLHDHTCSTHENNIFVEATKEYMMNTKPTKAAMKKVLDSLDKGMKTAPPLPSAETHMPPLMEMIPRKCKAVQVPGMNEPTNH